MLNKALGASQKFYKQHAPEVVIIQGDLIHNLIEQGRREEATIRNNNLDVQVLSYYNKHSLAYENNLLIDVEREVLNGEWKKVAKHMESYLSKEDLLPPLHKDRVKGLLIYQRNRQSGSRHG